MTAAVDLTDLAARRAVSALVAMCDELRVFAGADGDTGAAFAAHVRVDHVLDPVRTREAWRLLRRYRDHPAFPAAPELPTPAAPPLTPALPSTLGRPADGVTPDGLANLAATGQIQVKVPYDDRGGVRGITGSEWDKRRKAWLIPGTAWSAAALFDAYPNMKSTGRVAALAEIGYASRHGMQWTDPDVPLPDLDWDQWALSGVPGAPMWEHQIRGGLMASMTHAFILGTPMGGGKSATYVMAANRANARRLLIVCPDKVLGVWPKQFRKHSPIEWHVENGKRRNSTGRLVSRSVADRFDTAERMLFDCDCGAPHAVLVNYEALTREPWSSWLPDAPEGADGWALDAVIYDEGHRLTGTEVSKTARRYTRFTRQRWIGSGTPMPPKPMEIWGPSQGIDPGVYGPKKYVHETVFGEKGGFKGKQVVGVKPDKAKEFAGRFFSVGYFPVVDLDLPPTIDLTIDVELEPEVRDLYDKLEKEAWVDVGAAVERATGEKPREGAEFTMSPHNAAVLLTRCQQLTGGWVTLDDYDERGKRVVQRVSHAKQNAVMETLHELECRKGGRDGRSTPEPAVVFTRFVADLDSLAEIAEQLGVRYGEVSGRANDLTDDSTMPKAVDLLGVQLQSGGSGIDLTRSAIGGFYSMGYSLIDYLQARKRLDRPGQWRPVRFPHWIVDGTQDAEAYAALQARVDVLAALFAAHGHDVGKLGMVIESMTQVGVPLDEHGQFDPSLAAVFLPPEIAAFAPGAAVGSPAARASGRSRSTQQSRRSAWEIRGETLQPVEHAAPPGDDSVHVILGDGRKVAVTLDQLAEWGIE